MKAFCYNENRKMSCKDLEIKAGLAGYDFLMPNLQHCIICKDSSTNFSGATMPLIIIFF